jgi:hypothetical protein
LIVAYARFAFMDGIFTKIIKYNVPTIDEIMTNWVVSATTFFGLGDAVV